MQISQVHSAFEFSIWCFFDFEPTHVAAESPLAAGPVESHGACLGSFELARAERARCFKPDAAMRVCYRGLEI